MVKRSFLYVLALLTTVSHAFSPCITRSRCRSALKMAAVDMPPAVTIVSHTPSVQMISSSTTSSAAQSATLDAGIREYVAGATSAQQQPSSILLSLQERKPPTAEEIAQKKLTFNLIFWGGGIVAPFLATIFYFGFRFWEK